MRQIKFRAWDSRERKMKYTKGNEMILPTYGFYTHSKFVVVNFYPKNAHYGMFDFGLSDDEIMEWTGIDNIYEGDIIFLPEQNKYADVYFQDGSFRVLIPGENESTNLTKQFLDANYVELAGNIFENEELLKLGL